MEQEQKLSILDLNSGNIWNMTESEVAKLWSDEKEIGNFSTSEDKILNVIRLAFEVVHYDHEDERDVERFEKSGMWSIFTHCNPARGYVAIRRKNITKLTDLSYENIRHITAAILLELIDRNFGGGWDSISLAIKDIIETGFDISTTQLPTSRIHAPGGTLERKIKQGYEVLEIQKGTWTEAIFAMKKDLMEKPHYENPDESLDDEELLMRDEDDDMNLSGDNSNDEDTEVGDDTFYSSYSEEAALKNDDEEDSFAAIDEE